MSVTIALAGNPNCGKTTLFNALTGSAQFVGNWPGVTVEKKEGKLKDRDDVTVTDLPGIYSLSPYTPEEIVARKYLIDEGPDVILNIIDGTNIERNLYLTTQLIEIGIPVVAAVNMMDIVRKNGDTVDLAELEKRFGCKAVEISALKQTGIDEAAALAIQAAKTGRQVPPHSFSGEVEHALAHIEEAVLHDMPESKQRWYAIKLFERDADVAEKLGIDRQTLEHIDHDIVHVETEFDDDAEAIIANERYVYITNVIDRCVHRKNKNGDTVSDRIDRVVTNRFAALPIFAVMMFLVYFLSVTVVGGFVAGFAENGIFGEGWHLFGIGSAEYETAMKEYADNTLFTADFHAVLDGACKAGVKGADEIKKQALIGTFSDFDAAYGKYAARLKDAGFDLTPFYDAAITNVPDALPDASAFGIWVPGLPVLVKNGLERINCAPWLQGLVVDGILGGVGSVLSFVPQMLVLFFFLAFLEACGYMSRIAFFMDKIFRKFGLSGKSFIPILIGTGCSVPGIMSSRTIENPADRRMTVITTSFIPCGAKLPVIALISSAMFGGAGWVAPSAYLIGVLSIVVSGLILKKTAPFRSQPTPFVMELPAYHLPTFVNVMRSVWERTWSYIKKAGTIILLASVAVWAGSSFGFIDGAFRFSLAMPLENSLLGIFGSAICVIFTPLGFGNIRAAVATVLGLLAKEEIVGVFGVLSMDGFTKLSAFAFLMFNLLCPPCVAAMGAIRREMNSAKWTAFALAYQTVFAYAVSLMIYQFGSAVSGDISVPGLAAAFAALGLFVFMLARRPGKASLKK